jgi:hypothetical protein
MSDARFMEMLLTGGASALVAGGIGALAGAGVSKKRHSATIGALVGAAIGGALSTAYVDMNDMNTSQQSASGQILPPGWTANPPATPRFP